MAREKQLKKWNNRERLKTLINSGSVHPDWKSGGSGVRLPQPPQ
jgi:hypothetical protein